MPTNDPNSKPVKGVSYKPLTYQERSNWNRFLRFVYKNGYYGNKALDTRNKNLGEQLMEEYNEDSTNKAFPVSYDMVPRVQAEFQFFKDNGVFPDYAQGVYGNAFRKFIQNTGFKPKFSPVDDWFGSITSQQAYPVISDNEGHSWGTNYDAFFQHMGKKYPMSESLSKR